MVTCQNVDNSYTKGNQAKQASVSVDRYCQVGSQLIKKHIRCGFQQAPVLHPLWTRNRALLIRAEHNRQERIPAPKPSPQCGSCSAGAAGVAPGPSLPEATLGAGFRGRPPPSQSSDGMEGRCFWGETSQRGYQSSRWGTPAPAAVE